MNSHLTPERFDALMSGPEKIWGLHAIAKALNVSVPTARRLARHPDVPIRRPAGSARHFASRSDLVAWLRAEEQPHG